MTKGWQCRRQPHPPLVCGIGKAVLAIFLKLFQEKMKPFLLLLLVTFAKASPTFEIFVVSSHMHLNTRCIESLSLAYVRRHRLR